jgi:hypothetical protein
LHRRFHSRRLQCQAKLCRELCFHIDPNLYWAGIAIRIDPHGIDLETLRLLAVDPLGTQLAIRFTRELTQSIQ